MVLCLKTLTDLQTRRAGLSASAELLVLQLLPFISKTVQDRAIVAMDR